MSSADVANIVIAVVVLALLLTRQLMARRLSESYRLSIILAVLGVVEFVTFLKGHPHHGGAIAVAVAGSLVIAAASGAARTPTIRVWRQGDQLMRQGTWLTAVIWVVGYAAHLGWDYLVAGHVTGTNGGNVGAATSLLYLVVTLTIQRYMLLARVARQEAAGQVSAVDPHVPV
jgi:hypothetical protein